jgi:hypothetical protein
MPSGQPPKPEFPYGWRFVRRTLPDGSTELEQVPLTLEDVLHPQEDDVIPVRPIHALDCVYLADVFRTRPLGPAVTYVSFDHLVDWGVPGQRDTSPDVGVFVGLREPPRLAGGTLDLQGLGGRCLLFVEVVSPERRVNDVVHKFREYYLAGVPLYVLVDQEKEDGPRRILGYRWRSQGYEELASDEQGLYLEPLDLFLALGEQGRVVCRDAGSGRELGDYARLAQELEAADRRILEQAQVIEDPVQQAREQARAREAAERLAQEQQAAREAAERLAREHERREREQQSACEAAERLAQEQRAAREAAERRARETREAAAQQRQADEERIRELEAALARLHGASPP